MSENLPAFISGRENESLIVTTEQPLSTEQGVLLETRKGFILKLQEMVSSVSKWSFSEALPQSYQTPFILRYFVKDAEDTTFYLYKAEKVGKLEKVEGLKQTEEEPHPGENVDIFEGNEFNLLYEADEFRLEEKIGLLEGDNASGFEKSRPTLICQHRFQRTGKKDKYSLAAVDIGLATKNWNHIPQTLTIRKNHETGNFEIYNHSKGDYSDEGTLWTGSFEEIVEKANTLSGNKCFKIKCGEFSCPKRNPESRYIQEEELDD